MSIENSRIGGKADVPVIMMTVEAADSLVKKADADGRSLKDPDAFSRTRARSRR